MKCLKPFMIGKSIFNHPCGGCAGCRLRRSREWAVRCLHESVQWPENCFITLTYDNEHLPRDLSLSKKYFQDFMKRLRKELAPKVVRYFACGEYGGEFGRPHYHSIIFNHDFRNYAEYDLESGRLLSRSDVLSNAWAQGFVNVRDFNFERAQYVAKYVMKKLGGEMAEEYERIGIEPEFGLMSKGNGKGEYGGIGWSYFNNNKEQMKHDQIYVAGKTVAVPRYYRRKLEEEFGKDMARASRVSQYRIGAAEEIVERASAEGKRRDPRKYFAEVVGQRVENARFKEINDNLKKDVCYDL